MTETFAIVSVIGFGTAVALAIWLVIKTDALADARVAIRDARTTASRADARATAAEAVRLNDAATIVRLKAQVAKLQKERNEHAEANAQRGADGGGDAALRSIRELYPDADSDG